MSTATRRRCAERREVARDDAGVIRARGVVDADERQRSTAACRPARRSSPFDGPLFVTVTVKVTRLTRRLASIGVCDIVTARSATPLGVPHAENSDVLPDGSVAVAVTNSPAAGAEVTVNWKEVLPVPSVVVAADSEVALALAKAGHVARRAGVEVEIEMWCWACWPASHRRACCRHWPR